MTNITVGGDGTKGRIVSDELKELLRQKSTGNKNCVGYKHTEETRRNMSASRIGKKATAETRRNMSLALKGRKQTPISKMNIIKARLALIGRVHSKEEKERRNMKLRRKVCVDGILYSSVKECFKALKISSRTLWIRLNDKEFKNYNYVKDECNTFD